MSVNKLENGKWRVQVRDGNGRWFPRKVFERKVDAKKFESELINKKRIGTNAPSEELKAVSVSDYFVRWMKECRSDVSKGWCKTQKQVFKRHVEPVIGDTSFIEVDRWKIQEVMAHTEESGLKSQSRLHIYNMLRKMFEDGIEFYSFISVNPVLKRFKPKITKIEREFLSPEEAWKLMRLSKNEWFGPAVWLSILAGLRIGEVQALKWSSVDFENNRIIIKGSYNRKEKRMQSHPKQKNWGQAPMPDVLKVMLLEIKGESEDYVARSGGRNDFLSYDAFLKALKRFCKQVGVKIVSPHELRHTSTMLYYTQGGANSEDLRRLLNHASSKTTQTYIHANSRRLNEVAKQIVPLEPTLKVVS